MLQLVQHLEQQLTSGREVGLSNPAYKLKAWKRSACRTQIEFQQLILRTPLPQIG
jgi:hypothetical protein